MNHNGDQMTVGQNPELSEEISWQESAITGRVCILKMDRVFDFSQVCFPITSSVISYSFFNHQKISSHITGGIF